MATIKKPTAEGVVRDYKYATEISQMVMSVIQDIGIGNILIRVQMFVFGEVQDPKTETVNLVEDIVRSQLIELVSSCIYNPIPKAKVRQIVQARALAIRRGARYLSAEDLIFLIRHDRGKVNRLRTYLSWKDVRKHAKDSGGDGGGGVEEALEDGV
ncbi:hypothetical protein MPER_08432 [Moniliophthora perniciosa FA553]|nr:hypothetical protein MPER_08432 [Moniliophthora perniciosa FA553]